MARNAIGNKKAIAALEKVLLTANHPYSLTSHRFYTLRQVAESLGRIDPGNKKAICTLLELLENALSGIRHLSEMNRLQVVISLKKIELASKKAVDLLETKLQKLDRDYYRWQAADSLGRIDPGNQQAIVILVELLQLSNDEKIRKKAAESLRSSAIRNPKTIAALEKILQTPDDQNIHFNAARSLGVVDPGNENAVTVLLHLFDNHGRDNDWDGQDVAQSLNKNPEDNKTIYNGCF